MAPYDVHKFSFSLTQFAFMKLRQRGTTENKPNNHMETREARWSSWETRKRTKHGDNVKDKKRNGRDRKRWIIFEITNISQMGWMPWTFRFFSNSTRQSQCLFLWDCLAVGGSLLCQCSRCSLSHCHSLICVQFFECSVRECVFMESLLSSSWKHHWLSEFVVLRVKSLKYPGSLKWQQIWALVRN